MRVFDSHSHTAEFSPDGIQSFDELIADAEAQNLAGLMITENYDKDLINGIPFYDISEYGAEGAEGEWVFDFDACLARTERGREALAARGSDLKLLNGIEVGWLPRQRDKLWPFLAEKRDYFDGIIASVHCVDEGDIYYVREIYERGRDYAYGRYLEHCIDLLEANVDFDILGHFDYVVRYARFEDQTMRYREQAERLDRLFELLIAQGKSLEVNTRTRYRLMKEIGFDIGLPDAEIIRRYLELGGERITLSSDSHEDHNTGRFFADTIEWLRSAGVGRLCHFERREAQFTSIV